MKPLGQAKNKKQVMLALDIVHKELQIQKSLLITNQLTPTWENLTNTDYFKNVSEKYGEDVVNICKQLWENL